MRRLEYDGPRYRWDVDGDGAIDASGNATVETSYDSTGTVEPSVTVVDDGGQTDTASTVVNVTDTTPPTPVLDAPDGATTGESTTFSAVNSTDNGEIASYEWTFGDDTTASGETVSHIYETNGTYDVTLTVTDAAGNNATATTSISVGTSGEDDGADSGGGDGGDDGSDGSDGATSGGGGSTGGASSGGGGGGGGGGGTSAGTGGTSSPSPSPVVDATATGDGDVTVTARHLPADERVDVALPAVGSTPARFERLAFVPTSDADRLSFTLTGANASGVPADQVLGGVDVRGGSDADPGLGEVQYEFTVPESTSAGDVALYTRQNGTWVRSPASVVEGSDGRVRLRASAPALGPTVVGLRQSNVSVADVSTSVSDPLGDTVRVRARVVNTGRLNGSETVSFSVDGDPVTERTVSVPAGDERTVTFDHTFTANGSHAIGVGSRTTTVRVAPREPAFAVTDLSVSAERVAPGEPVVVTATVANDGTASGQYEASLRLFGDVVEAKRVSVPPGERRTVTFRRQVVAPGVYTAAVGEQRVEFTVVETETRTATSSPTASDGPGFGWLIGLTALLIASFVLRRR